MEEQENTKKATLQISYLISIVETPQRLPGADLNGKIIYNTTKLQLQLIFHLICVPQKTAF